MNLRDILIEARKLVAQEWNLSDAVYQCAVNGESDAAAMQALYDAGLRSGILTVSEALAIFDRAIANQTKIP